MSDVLVSREAGRSDSCPYCGVRSRNSDDHVFSEFLGGQTTIRSCRPCNNLFGHSFEGPLSNDLAPLIVTLRRGGLRAPRTVVWRRALQRDGIDHDLDSDLNLTRTRPSIEKDEKGQIKRALFPNRKAAGGLLKGLEALGKKVKTTSTTLEGIDIRQLNFSLKIGSELRRLTVKMSVATAEFMGKGLGILDLETRGFLLGTTEKSTCVRTAFPYPELERLAPPLSHSVFVKGNSSTGRCYGVVQLYGLLQFYVVLNDKDFKGPDFAVIGLLDIAAHYAESFSETELFLLREAPVEVSILTHAQQRLAWQQKFNREAASVLQDGANICL